MKTFSLTGAGLALAFAFADAQGQAAGARIPALHGAVLTGEKVDLPAALNGRVGVLVVGFSQSSRDEVTGWGKRLAGDYRESSSVLYYEMPVLASVPKLVRGWVLGRIRGNVPVRAQSRFLPVLDHEDDWKLAAAYGPADHAYILLVDGDGFVRWKTQGAATDSSYAEVKRHVEDIRTRSQQPN